MAEQLNYLEALPSVARLLEVASLTGAEILERYPERRFFGFTCSYWPEELTLAVGLEPLRLFPVNPRAMPPELPAFSCSLARGILGELKGTGLKRLVGLGLAQTCDTMQCLGSISQEILSERTLELVPPVLLVAPGASSYYIAESRQLWLNLIEISGKEPGAVDLANSVELYRRIRRLALSLDEMRPRLPSQLVSALLRAGQLMPREDYANSLEEAMEYLPTYADELGEKHRIILSGAVLEGDSLYVMIEELGGRVVADDTCTGTRHYSQMSVLDSSDISEILTGGPLEWVALRHLAMPLCPCRHRQLEERLHYLEGLALEQEVQGVILVVRKYCDPHAWDAVPITSSLEKRGIRTLVLELEGAEVGGQERTRLQAFLESLG